MEAMFCPNCNGNGKVVFPEGLKGEAVCSRCGLVLDKAVVCHGRRGNLRSSS